MYIKADLQIATTPTGREGVHIFWGKIQQEATKQCWNKGAWLSTEGKSPSPYAFGEKWREIQEEPSYSQNSQWGSRSLCAVVFEFMMPDAPGSSCWDNRRPEGSSCLYYLLCLPSQLSPVWSREKPRWHSHVKLPGVFWQIPLAPHRLISEAHSLLSKGKTDESITTVLQGNYSSWRWSFKDVNSIRVHEKQRRNISDTRHWHDWHCAPFHPVPCTKEMGKRNPYFSTWQH